MLWAHRLLLPVAAFETVGAAPLLTDAYVEAESFSFREAFMMFWRRLWVESSCYPGDRGRIHRRAYKSVARDLHWLHDRCEQLLCGAFSLLIVNVVQRTCS